MTDKTPLCYVVIGNEEHDARYGAGDWKKVFFGRDEAFKFAATVKSDIMWVIVWVVTIYTDGSFTHEEVN